MNVRLKRIINRVQKLKGEVVMSTQANALVHCRDRDHLKQIREALFDFSVTTKTTECSTGGVFLHLFIE